MIGPMAGGLATGAAAASSSLFAAQAARTALAQSAGGKISYGTVGGYNPASRGAAPVQSPAPVTGVEETHIPDGESFADYLVRRGGEQAAASAVAPTGRAAVTYGRNGYDPKNRAALESSYSALPATPSAAFVATPPVPAGAGRARIDYGKPGYSPQSRPAAPASATSSSSEATEVYSASSEAPVEAARPASGRKLTYGTPAYNPKARGALERAYSAPDGQHQPPPTFFAARRAQGHHTTLTQQLLDSRKNSPRSAPSTPPLTASSNPHTLNPEP